jgi:Family of unknown function (DUF6159)
MLATYRGCLMGSIFRVFGFTAQVFGMVGRNPRLLTPVALNIGIAAPVNILLVIAMFLVPDAYQRSLGNVVAFIGVSALYFIDYFCAGLTASMVYDQVTTGDAQLGPAFKRTLKASPGILIFAVVSGFFDLLSHLASQREGIMRVIGPVVMAIVRAVWTTATYVIMPALVIEGIGFGDAFKRSKNLMENDPTQVGVGVVGLGMVTYVLNVVIVGAAFTLLNAIPNLIIGGILFFTLVNAFWAISGYLKGVYYTCYYLWAVECERQHSASPQLAPEPLRNVVAGASY